jgi:hypothetical protein
MFTGNEDYEITLQEGVDLTKRYQSLFAGGVKGVYISQSSLQDLLGQSTAVGVRIYFGLTSGLKMTCVLVAVNSNGEDLSAGIIVDQGSPCPPGCDPNSPL